MQGRHLAVRRRIRAVEAVLVGTSIALFAGTAALARAHFPGHRKAAVTPLGPPAPLLRVVRRNQLAAGIVAPLQAPPGIGSLPS